MSKPKDIYLLANYVAKPKNPKLTFKAEYMKDPGNIAWDEKVQVTKGLRQKDLLSSKIVLNINAQKVERNAFQNNKTFMELFEYFYSSSPQYISQALRELGIQVGVKSSGENEEHVPNEGQTIAGSEFTTPGDPIITSEETT